MKISKTGIKLTLAVTALFIISTVVLAVALVFNIKCGQGADDNGSKELPPPHSGTGLLIKSFKNWCQSKLKLLEASIFIFK